MTRIHVETRRLLAPRMSRTLQTVAPRVCDKVIGHFGRRPLAPIRITLTNPSTLEDIFLTSQRAAARIPRDAPTPRRMLEAPSARLRCITGLSDSRTGGTLTLLNGRQLRTRAALEDALLYEMVRVIQLTRRGTADQWISHLRDLSGTAPLPRRDRIRLDSDLEKLDSEARNTVHQLRQQKQNRLVAT